MRDSSSLRSVALNRPVVTITSSVYDRRALDINSSIPLINSLNHLTYLTSNSGKVRETISNDGALSRLVTILHDCHLELGDILGTRDQNRHKRLQEICKSRRLAACAWKWTLAFQCVVLTATRGNEQIRKKVVLAGIIPILATILDNYLFFHKNYDFVGNSSLDYDFKDLLSEKMYLLLRNSPDESYQEYIKSIVGFSNDTDFPSLSQTNIDIDNLLKPTSTIPSDFGDIWASQGDNTDTAFQKDPNNLPAMSIPREFYLGRIVSKQDDVVWSLQLLAFISKYTYMKERLQNVRLVDALSFRYTHDRIVERMAKINRKDLLSSNSIAAMPQGEEQEMADIVQPKLVDSKDPLLNELLQVAEQCLKEEKITNTRFKCVRNSGFPCPKGTSFSHTKKDQQILSSIFDSPMSKELDEDAWNSMVNKLKLNIFPIVERYTVLSENPHDMIYWGSIIMRNSCRKNEITGVRQCANFDCGKWESYPRQFAKCRRCKRTKYCSRDCQLKSWKYHRYWCHEAGSNMSSAGTINTATNTPNPGNPISSTTTVSGHTTETDIIAHARVAARVDVNTTARATSISVDPRLDFTTNNEADSLPDIINASLNPNDDDEEDDSNENNRDTRGSVSSSSSH